MVLVVVEVDSESIFLFLITDPPEDSPLTFVLFGVFEFRTPGGRPGPLLSGLSDEPRTMEELRGGFIFSTFTYKIKKLNIINNCKRQKTYLDVSQPSNVVVISP